MDDLGLWYALYSASTLFFYVLWRLLGKPLWVEKIRDYGNLFACFLPFPMYVSLLADYIPHGIPYVAYMKGYLQISNSCRDLQSFYQFLPLIFFIFALPMFRKSWQISLIISLIAVPAIDFSAFTTWLYAIPDDFNRFDSGLDEVLYMSLFSQKFNSVLDVFSLLLLLILRLERSNS
jgi:hypothetical protein